LPTQPWGEALLIDVLALLAFWSAAPAAPPPAALGPELAAIRAAARDQGDPIWPGFGDAPFDLLLLEPGGETLLCRPAPPPGFSDAGVDAATGCPRFIRPRGTMPANWLAAMPLFGPPSTIVMGTSASTGLARSRWRSTVIHEHVHQWQAALPAHYARVAALDLAGGDETGMWMLNFAFPYAEAGAVAAHAAASRALAAALAARGTPAFRARLADYLTLRRAFAAAAGARNWRYFEFQLWQEGVARWTEIAISRRWPDPAMRAEADAYEREIFAALGAPDLAGQQRVAVYPMGAGEAMLLEACGPRWRVLYPAALSLGPLFETCGIAP
jgi:hypothetical protein